MRVDRFINEVMDNMCQNMFQTNSCYDYREGKDVVCEFWMDKKLAEAPSILCCFLRSTPSRYCDSPTTRPVQHGCVLDKILDVQ